MIAGLFLILSGFCTPLAEAGSAGACSDCKPTGTPDEDAAYWAQIMKKILNSPSPSNKYDLNPGLLQKLIESAHAAAEGRYTQIIGRYF